MSKEVKNMMIDALAARFREVEECVIVDISTLDSEENTTFRNTMRDGGINVQGVKAAVARRAVEGLPLEPARDILKGHSYIATGSTDIVALSKALVQWAKDNEKLVVKGAVYEGQALDGDGVTELSKMPSREELLAGIIGMALGQGQAIASQIKAVGSGLATQVDGLVEKLEAQGA